MNENSSSSDIRDRAITVLSIVLPLLAVIAVTRLFVLMLSPGTMPAWAAFFLGVVVGIGVIALYTVSFGSETSDLLIGSFFVLVVALVLFPIFSNAKSSAERHKRQLQEKMSLEEGKAAPVLRLNRRV